MFDLCVDAVPKKFDISIDNTVSTINNISSLIQVYSTDSKLQKGFGQYTGFIVPLNKNYLLNNLNKANVIFLGSCNWCGLG